MARVVFGEDSTLREAATRIAPHPPALNRHSGVVIDRPIEPRVQRRERLTPATRTSLVNPLGSDIEPERRRLAGNQLSHRPRELTVDSPAGIAEITAHADNEFILDEVDWGEPELRC